MNQTDYRYKLESLRITGQRQHKFQCPQCGKKKCFVRYVDTRRNLRYVADNVGKCDHQHSCGYHYTPSEYYRDNRQDSEPAPDTEHRFEPKPLPPFQPMPMDYVVRSHSMRSTFWQWLSTSVAQRLSLTAEQLQRVFHDYLLGATRKGHVIFWQIDGKGRVHGGHIMQYRPDGHRDGYQGWTHPQLIRQGLLPLDWQLYQCLFGEHLLPLRPEARVCLVESEKTAVVMSACQPQHLWLATAGSGGLSPERLACLAGRRVTVFPDSGCYEKWNTHMQLTKGIDYNISRRLEAWPPNTDLCDLLLQ